MYSQNNKIILHVSCKPQVLFDFVFLDISDEQLCCLIKYQAFTFLLLSSFTFAHLLSFTPLLQLRRFFLFLFLFLFFLPFFTSIAFAFFLSSFFIFSHWCFCGFYCTFLWVYLFLNQWVLFGLMQRRERQRLDFCSWVVCLCGGWVVWVGFLRVGIGGFGLSVVVGGGVAPALALAPTKCSNFR